MSRGLPVHQIFPRGLVLTVRTGLFVLLRTMHVYLTQALNRLANVSVDFSWVARDIELLRLQALLARAHGDAAAYAHVRDRYRDMARTLNFEGHIAWAEAMP